MSAVQMAMQFTQQDFANASASYNSEFSRSMQLIDLFSGLQDREEAREDRAEARRDKLADNARANLQTITNLVKDSGKSFGDMSDDQRRNIRQWEIQAGLPIGTYETFAVTKPQAKILHTSTGTDASGNQIVTFIYDDGSGKPGLVEVVNTGGVLSSIVQQATESGNAVTAETAQSITSILGSSKLGQTTKTSIGTILGVINAAEDLAKARSAGKFSGFYPGAGIVDMFLPDALKKKETIENEGYLNAINLKVQQWASGATLTENQTRLVQGMVPKKNDSDEKVRVKLNNLINFMNQQIKGSLASEGVPYEPIAVDLFAKDKSLADIFNE